MIVVKIANLQVAMKFFTKKGTISKLILAYCGGVNYHFTIGARSVGAIVRRNGADRRVFNAFGYMIVNAGIAVDGDPTSEIGKQSP